VAGVVEEADEGSAFKKGDRVFGCTGQQMFNNRCGEPVGRRGSGCVGESGLRLLEPGAATVLGPQSPLSNSPLTARSALNLTPIPPNPHPHSHPHPTHP
jgi:hypothetical protein